MTSSQDGVRRKLDFVDKPYARKTFYLDIKAFQLKTKVSKRILELGGHVEEFLSKEVHLLVTDKNGEKEEKKNNLGQDRRNSLPLSRGQALMMKATKASSDVQNGKTSNAMDPVLNAKQLGVDVQQANIFLKDSNKLLHKLRQKSCQIEKENEDIDMLDGISPLKWKACEKENFNIIKLEDTGEMFKPTLKYFDKLPHIRYDENLISPFDKNVILQRRSEKVTNRYSAKRKTLPPNKKGGFCEACDYWFKCSLREHLNSEKHQLFVKQCVNFIKMDEIINKLPSVRDFMVRYKMESKGNSAKHISEDETLSSQPSKSAEIEKDSDVPHLPSSKALKQPGLKPGLREKSEHSKDISHNIMLQNKEPISNGGEVELKMPAHLSKSLICNTHIEMPEDKERILKSADLELECDSLATELYYFGSANESVTRDHDCQDAKDLSQYIPCDRSGPEVLESDTSNENIDSDLASPLHMSSLQCNKNSETNTHSVRNVQSVPIEDCDNAVYIGKGCNSSSSTTGIPNSTTLSFKGAFNSTKNIENSTSCQSLSHVSAIKSKSAIPMFSPITSPTSEKSNYSLNFAQVASNWIKDISASCQSSHTENSTSKDSTQSGNVSVTTHVSNSVSSIPYQNVPYGGHENTQVTGHQDTPIDLSKTADVSVSRKLQYCSAFKMSRNSQSDATTDEISLLSLPYGSEDSRSSMLIPLHSEVSCCSTSSVTSESSWKESLPSSLKTDKSTPRNFYPLNNTEESEADTPKAANDSVFLDNSDDTIIEENKENRQPIKLKISLSGIKGKSTGSKKSSRKRSRRQLSSDSTDTSQTDVYVASQQSDTRIKICKVLMTPLQQNLSQYWKVRKSGGCRLVFSSEKRKAERLGSSSSDVHGNESLHHAKRRKLVDFM